MSFPAQFSSGRSGARRAFTLLEVLIVIALMALVAGLVVMDFTGLTDRWARPTDFESLQSALKTARAVSARERAALVFSADAYELRVMHGDAFESFPMESGARFFLPADESGGVAQDLTRIVFSPEGDATPSIIELTGRTRSVRYRLEPFSGALSEESP